MKNYYKILGISKAATIAEIKTAYRTMALQYHPDKNKNPSAASTFIEITEAYQILLDPLKRHEYDNLLNEYTTLKEYDKERFRSSDSYKRYTDWVEVVRNTALKDLGKIGDQALTETFHFINRYGWFIILAFFAIILILSQTNR